MLGGEEGSQVGEEEVAMWSVCNLYLVPLYYMQVYAT